MPEANALFAQAPAEINLFVVNDGRKIQQARIKVLYQAAGRLNALKGGFERFGELIVLETQPSRFLVRDDGAADPLNVRGNGSEFFDQRGQFFAHFDGFDEDRLDFAPSAFSLGERKQPRFRSFLLVFFVCHGWLRSRLERKRQRETTSSLAFS